MKEESLLLLSDLQKLINQVVLIDYTIIILGSEFMDIKQLIGEATDYDKKVALEEKKPKSWCKSISAFANCFGGKLIFGVSNNSELVGLADAESDAEKISEIIKTHLNPIPEFKLSFEKIMTRHSLL